MSDAIQLRDKIVRLLALTQSANDHEALSAVRHANAMLSKRSLDWHQFLKVPIPVVRNNAVEFEPFEVRLRKCRSCGVTIGWLRTRRGKWIQVLGDTIEEGDQVYDYDRHEAHFERECEAAR